LGRPGPTKDAIVSREKRIFRHQKAEIKSLPVITLAHPPSASPQAIAGRAEALPDGRQAGRWAGIALNLPKGHNGYYLARSGRY